MSIKNRRIILPLKLAVFGVLILYFQILFASKFEISNVIPNILVGFVIYVNVRLALKETIIYAFLLGLAYDLNHPQLLGFNTFSFLIVSFLVNNYHKNINKNKVSSILIGLSIINIVYFLPFIIYNIIIFSDKVRNITDLSYLLLNVFKFIYYIVVSFCTVIALSIIDKLKIYIDA